MVNVHIPYFGGDSSAAYSDKKNRLNYLLQTISGLKLNLFYESKEDFNITIHVCNLNDENALNQILRKEHKIVKHDTVNPIFLASDCVNYAKTLHKDDEIVLYTEADQVFFFSDFRFLVQSLTDSNYIAPHRIEEIPWINPRCHHNNNGEFLEINDRYYQVQNRLSNNGEPYELNSQYYKPLDWCLGFGGAFLIKGSALNKIKISYSSSFPVEHASGIDAFNSLTCLKTNKFEGFQCIHLSGYEKNLNGNIKVNKK